MIKPRYLIFLIIYFCNTLILFAQQLTIRDKTTGEPIEKVALYTPSMKKYAFTDLQGHVSIDNFDTGDTIIFQHPSYKKLRKTKKDILSGTRTIFLSGKFILLEESVVSATRWEQNRHEIPNKIEKIDVSRVSFFNPQTTADLLGASDLVFIQKSQMGGGSPVIRGFAANSLLIVVDGVRMNNAIFRSGNLQNVILIDPNTTQSAEIIFGPGTVIYGSDALGGVMDFHSLHPSLSTSDKSLVKINAMGRFASANNEKTGHFDIMIGKKRISWISGFTWSDYRDLRMGSQRHPEYQRREYVRSTPVSDTIIQNPDPNLQVPTGYHQFNLLQKIRYRPADDLDFYLTFHYSTSGNIPRYDRLIRYSNGTLKYARWYYGPQQWLMPVFTMENNRKTRFYDQMKVNAAWQYYTESRHDRKSGEELLHHRTEKVYSGTLNADFTKEISPEKKSLFYGFESIYNNVVSAATAENIYSGITYPAASRYPDGYNHYYAVATYLMYKNNISEKFTLNIGGRYNFTGLHSMIEDVTFYDFPFSNIDLDNNAFNGSVGFACHPALTWQFNMNLSSGFRAPNLDDAGKVFDSEPGKVIVPNKDLKPEYVYNLDAVLIHSKNNLFKIEYSAFFSYLDNAMVRRPFPFNGRDSLIYDNVMSEIQALTNTGYATIYGSAMSVTVFLPANFSLRTSLTGTYGKDNDGFPLRHAAPLFGATHLIYESKTMRADLSLRYNGSVPNSRLAPSEQSKTHIYAMDKNGNPYSPGWTTINLMTSFHLPLNLNLEAGIENIFDVRYRPYSSGIVAPGRNFILTLRYFPG